MITLDFEMDQHVLEEDLRASPVNADAGVLEETYFVMPVKFVVDGTDLLSLPGHQAHSLPLLGFTTHMLQALEQMAYTGQRRVYLAGGGDISLRAAGNRVEISSSLTNRQVTVDRAELLLALRNLAARVQQQLRSLVPGMDRHSSWRNWFPL